MKCLVGVKRVIDFNVKVRVKADKTGVETSHVKMSMNPFDEIALEEAVRQKEAGHVSEVLAVSIGPDTCQETLRTALARGADRALHIKTDTLFEPLNIAKLFRHIVQQEGIQLVLLGKQAIDDDCNQTGQMLAGLLGWSQGTNISKMDLDTSKQMVKVIREVDGGLETLHLQLPSVLTADLRLNEPRYVSLPNVMKAKSKSLTTLQVSDLNIKLNPHSTILSVEAPSMHRTSQKLNSVSELIEKLRFEAKVI